VGLVLLDLIMHCGRRVIISWSRGALDFGLIDAFGSVVGSFVILFGLFCCWGLVGVLPVFFWVALLFAFSIRCCLGCGLDIGFFCCLGVFFVFDFWLCLDDCVLSVCGFIPWLELP